RVDGIQHAVPGHCRSQLPRRTAVPDPDFDKAALPPGIPHQTGALGRARPDLRRGNPEQPFEKMPEDGHHAPSFIASSKLFGIFPTSFSPDDESAAAIERSAWPSWRRTGGRERFMLISPVWLPPAHGLVSALRSAAQRRPLRRRI